MLRFIPKPKTKNNKTKQDKKVCNDIKITKSSDVCITIWTMYKYYKHIQQKKGTKRCFTKCIIHVYLQHSKVPYEALCQTKPLVNI